LEINMAKIRLLNASQAPIHLNAYANDGTLQTAVIPAARGILPGEAMVDESLLDALRKKEDAPTKAHFESGRLRVGSQATVPDEPAPLVPVPEQTAPEAPVVPPVPAAPADNEVPEVSSNTPADAPWATGNAN
jgi:hypothetical protein